MPEVEAQMENGHFDALNDWRRKHIWSQGSRWPTPELIERATGEPLNAEHFRKHLEARYG
jgi:carboxypeptidase Taq